MKALLWIGWAFGLLMIFVMASQEDGFSYSFRYAAENGNWIVFILASIWIWGTIRWIVIKIKGAEEKLEISFIKILFVNFLAPTAVSLVLYYITGSSSITLISVPIIGGIAASIDIG
jgi:hypothetical protein